MLYPNDILHVNVKRSQSGMKKILAPLTACIWAWLISFLKLFLVFQYGVQARVPFSLKLIQPLTGFSVRSFRKYFQLEVFAWGFFLFILSCAWHQLQVLFLFWMERILSSIPKGPFGFFFFLNLPKKLLMEHPPLAPSLTGFPDLHNAVQIEA